MLPGSDFTLDVHSIILGKSSRQERTSFYGNMRNFYFNGERLFDHMSSGGIVDPTTRAPTTTRRPDHHRDFDGYEWIWYDLERLPRSYLSRNVRESFELVFRAIRPDGLLWYTGNDQNNMHLSLKVRMSYRITTR